MEFWFVAFDIPAKSHYNKNQSINQGDVNPPVHAYAAYKVYKIDAEQTGVDDVVFLERIFHKLLLNFTWWVNRKDESGNNVFQGGFLGLDNIGVFDRSAPLPTGGILEQVQPYSRQKEKKNSKTTI